MAQAMRVRMIQRPLAPGTLVTAGASPQGDASLLGRYRRIRASSGGGFLFSRLVSDRAGTMIAALAEPLKAHPSVLTLGNLALGVAGSAIVVLGAGAKAISVTGLAGLVLWQFAYALDCADGQLARATGTTSPSGARVAAASRCRLGSCITEVKVQARPDRDGCQAARRTGSRSV